MKLTALECPKCNAPLEINPESTYVTCNCCGCRFMIDSESGKAIPDSEDVYKMGYAFERGRYERQSQECRNLANKVKVLKKPIMELQARKSTLEFLSAQISSLKAKQQQQASFIGKIKTFQIPAYLLAATILLSVLGIGIGITFAGIIASAILFWIMSLKRKKDQEAVSNLIQQNSEALAKTRNEIHLITTTYEIELIPEKYHTETAIDYICEVLCNQRAFNISQALNLYEDDMHKKRMENFQKEQLEIQRAEKLQRERLEMQRIQMMQQTQIAQNRKKKSTENSWELGSLVKAGGMLLAVASFIKKLDDK